MEKAILRHPKTEEKQSNFPYRNCLCIIPNDKLVFGLDIGKSAQKKGSDNGECNPKM
jgi:hypothetical protein